MSFTALTSSDLKSADAAISAAPCYLHAITLIPAAADCAVVLYDNASAASGTVLAKLSIVVTTADGSNNMVFNNPVYCAKGIYADVSGTGANYIVHFSS